MDLFTKFAESNYFEPIFLFFIVGIPVIALVLYLKQPVWFQDEQSRKYVKITIVIYLLLISVLIFEKLGIMDLWI
jgi:uncharacterized membrane protein